MVVEIVQKVNHNRTKKARMRSATHYLTRHLKLCNVRMVVPSSLSSVFESNAPSTPTQLLKQQVILCTYRYVPVRAFARMHGDPPLLPQGVGVRSITHANATIHATVHVSLLVNMDYVLAFARMVIPRSFSSVFESMARSSPVA